MDVKVSRRSLMITQMHESNGSSIAPEADFCSGESTHRSNEQAALPALLLVLLDVKV